MIAVAVSGIDRCEIFSRGGNPIGLSASLVDSDEGIDQDRISCSVNARGVGKLAAKKPPAMWERNERREVQNESLTGAGTSSSRCRDHRGDIRFPPTAIHKYEDGRREFPQTSPS